MSLFEPTITRTENVLLTQKYRPLALSSFIGLERPRRICEALAANPYDSAWLFKGESGLGKTTMAMALAEALPAELHHIPSQDCNLETLRRVLLNCQYYPRNGAKKHLILVDEADQMSKAAQLYLLSKLDSTCMVPDTIWIFTCNSTDGLEDRFRSRCQTVEFSAYGAAPKVAAFLTEVWQLEAPQGAVAPNFARIAKDATGNVRTALMALQNELILA
jgi:replication-associated recombination protein RarA